MRLIRRLSVLLLALAGPWLQGQTPPFTFPAISTDLSGVVERKGIPPIKWRLQTKPAGPAADVVMTAESQGAAARIEAAIDPRTADGHWRVVNADLDLGQWFEVLQAVRPVLPKGTHAGGTIKLTGEGLLKAGIPAGHFTGTLTSASLGNEDKEWSATGIAATIDLPQLPSLASDKPHVYTFKEAMVSGLIFSDGQLAVQSIDPSTLRVLEAKLHGLGGEFSLEPFELDVLKPEVTIKGHLRSVDLTHLRAFFPAVVAEVSGQVDGDMTLSWGASGLGACEIFLRPAPNQTAIMRLKSVEPLLSAKVPGRVALLPTKLLGVSLNRLRNWFLVGVWDLPQRIRRVETGAIPLIVESIHVKYTPPTATEGPKVRIHLPARPVDVKASKLKLVRFNINVDAPLTDLIRMSFNDPTMFGAE